MTLIAPATPANGNPRTAAVRRRRLPTLLTAMFLGALALSGARADEERDHQRARSAVQAGDVLPLPTLLERLRRTHPGQVLELELEREGGRWIYEVKLLQSNGQLSKLELDAGTGQVLQVKHKQDRSKDRQGGNSKETPN